MDVDLTTTNPSNSSMDLMKMIDDANRATTGPETEQWTIRGWPKGLAIFHKTNCRCCNDYVAHAIHACKEQGVNLPLQVVGDTVTKAWPMLMQDLKDEAQERALESYKDLADDAASLKAELKVSKAALDSEHSRIERWDVTIRDLKDKIAALQRPPSTVSTAMSSMRPVTQSLHAAGPPSCPMAPLPVRAHSGLAARITNPGLAAQIDAHSKADRPICRAISPMTCPSWTHQCRMAGSPTPTGDRMCPSGMR
jgi:hypothetical protein